MPITIRCLCKKQMNVPEILAGKRIKCAGCGRTHRVPSPRPDGQVTHDGYQIQDDATESKELVQSNVTVKSDPSHVPVVPTSWSSAQFKDLPDQDRAAVEQARKHAEANQWNDAIALLEAYPFQKSDRHIVSDAIAFCYHGRAAVAVNETMQVLAEPSYLQINQHERASYKLLTGYCPLCGERLPDSEEIDEIAEHGMPELLPSFVNLEGKNGTEKTLICAACAIVIKLERENRQKALNEPLRRAKRDLDKALKYAPEDDGIQSSIALVEKMATANDLSLSACFIATAACGCPLAIEVEVLRNLRDFVVRKTSWGDSVVRLYYRVSPPIARTIARSRFARAFVRGLLRPVVALCRHRIVASPLSFRK
jgi:hypothetical protein